jgi:hypothetical protein
MMGVVTSSSDPEALAALVEDLAADIERGRRSRVRVYGPDDELPPAAVASLERVEPMLEDRHRAVFGDR